MDRIYASGASATPPSVPASPSSGYPTAGNPGASVPATKPGEYWYYMITEEIRKVISDAGLTPAGGNVSQLSAAIQQLISNGSQPAGTVIYFAKNTPPTGYLKANGAAVSRTTYASLFAVIGTTFGAGDGSTTFNLPDLRGEFVRGWDDSRGVDSGRAFGSAQADDFKAHNHGLNMWTSTAFDTTGGQAAVGADSAGSSAGVSNSLGTITNTGGTETRPRNVAMLACIKY